MKYLLSLTIATTMLLTSTIGHTKAQAKKILIVLTSHSQLGDTGLKTGFWLPELTHPYYEFKKAGHTVDVASPQGGMAPLDAKVFDEPDAYHDIFLKDAELMAKVIRTIPLSKIDASKYQAILFSGGSGPMWDFPDSKDIQNISREIYESGGIVSAVCHGPAALINIKLSNGKYLISGKRLSSFTNEEEEMLGQTKIVPYLLESKLIERGAIHIGGKAWEKKIIVDGRLMTGQNPASAKELAIKIIAALK